MYLIYWITVGLVVGWLSGRALKAHGYGPLMDIAMASAVPLRADFSRNPQGSAGIREPSLLLMLP